MHHVQFHTGSTLAVIGRPEEALDWLTRAANEGYPSYPRFSTDQTLLPLKGHARFVARRAVAAGVEVVAEDVVTEDVVT